MPTLHDRTRRAICRIVFLAICPLPTVSLILWAAWLHTPFYRQAAIDAVGQRLSTRVALSSIRNPAPGRVRYLNLMLADPEVGTPLLTFDVLEATKTSAGISISAHQGHLSAVGLDRLGELLARELAGPFATDVRLLIGEVDGFSDRGSPRSLYNLRARLESVPQGRRVVCEFHTDADVAAGSIEMTATRNRQVAPPVTLVEVDARTVALPCTLMATVVPTFGGLGARSRFQGYLWTRRSSRAFDAELAGTFSDCDLTRLASTHSPHQIKGNARIDLERIAMRDGRLVQATGRLTAGPGVMDTSLYKAAIAGLQLRPGRLPTPNHAPRQQRPAEPILGESIPGAQFPFDRLAFKFHLSSEGLWIAGECPDAAQGAVAMYHGEPILYDAARQPQSVSAIVRTLAPQNGDYLPATLEAAHLTRLLPLPTGLPTRLARQPADDP